MKYYLSIIIHNYIYIYIYILLSCLKKYNNFVALHTIYTLHSVARVITVLHKRICSVEI